MLLCCCIVTHEILNFLSLAKVLDGNQDAAKHLAEAVHQTITMDTDPKLKENQSEVCIDDFGIWIDPIGQPSYVLNINIFGYSFISAILVLFS